MNKPYINLSLVLLLAATVAWSQKTAPPEHTGSSYVGSDTCQPCHDDIYRTVSDSGHQAYSKASNQRRKDAKPATGRDRRT